MLIAIVSSRLSSWQRPSGLGARAADSRASCAGTRSACVPFPAPDERGRLSVPAAGRSLQPLDDLLWRCRLLTSECASFEDALDGFRPVQPRPAHRRVERHDPVREQPADEVGGVMTGQMIEDQEHAERSGAERRWVLRQAEAHAQSVLPACPAAPGAFTSGGSATGSGRSAKIPTRSALSQGCRMAFAVLVTPLLWTMPLAGGNTVSCLAVPVRS